LKDIMNHKLLLTAFLAATALPAANAQSDNFFSAWQDRVRSTLAQQPSFPIPVIAPSSQMVQLFRFDLVHEYTPTRTVTTIYDNSKGVNLVPLRNVELDINLPPFIHHNTPKSIDGPGDFTTVLKYRPFKSNDKGHRYSAAIQLAASVPTGSYKNGTAVSTLTPTLMGAKGFGSRFSLQSTLGGTLPTSETKTLGRTVTWNTTAQYKVGKIFYPEVEVNANYYHLGPNDGKNQTFLSPGMMVSKLKFRKDPKDRLSLIFGGGFQVATSTYHSYNHAVVFTSRFAF
jgi:hypothetical protein